MATATGGAEQECCMCGDYGLPTQLFRCKVCRSRSQHRYCSNLYPRAETYRVCNWCLLLHQPTTATDARGPHQSIHHKTPEFSSAASPSVLPSRPAGDVAGAGAPEGGEDRNGGRRGGLKIHLRAKAPDSPIKKPPQAAAKSPGERSLVAEEEKEREEKIGAMNGVGKLSKQTRSKVRRYRLLDEVSN